MPTTYHRRNVYPSPRRGPGNPSLRYAPPLVCPLHVDEESSLHRGGSDRTTGPSVDAARESLCSGRVKKPTSSTRSDRPRGRCTGRRGEERARNGSGGGDEWRRPLQPVEVAGVRAAWWRTRRVFRPVPRRSPPTALRAHRRRPAVKSAAAVLSQCRFVDHTQYTTHTPRSSAVQPIPLTIIIIVIINRNNCNIAIVVLPVARDC